MALVTVATLVAARPRRGRSGWPVAAWIACLGLSCAAAGAAVGALRLEAIDGGALDLAAGTRATVRGHVGAVPRRADGEVSVRVETARGRVLVVAPEPVGDLEVGALVRAQGAIRDPGDWQRPMLTRQGIADVLVVREIEALGGGRGGIAGVLDGVRSRAESALGRGTSEPAAALLRGFVLGQDDRIDAATVEEFKRSGLAHLLAVSGQNVVLLALLAAAVLAVLGVPLRARLLWIGALIVLYVPVAGAGPSIQRAGVMGAAGVIAALAGRPRSRWYALALAAAATLALDPRAAADIGWQLSFAAVAGILLLTAPLAAALGAGRGGWRRALAEGGALTIAATLATAPLMSLHFGTVSAVTLGANLLALPAVAPVMWLGMLAGAVGQLPGVPVEPLVWPAGALAGYIAQVAGWLAAPGWAQVGVSLGGPAELAAVYAGLAAGAAVALRAARRRRALGTAAARSQPAVLAVAGLALVAGIAIVSPPGEVRAPPEHGLRVRVLDVGQGDAILLEPAGADPVLVDTGPPQALVADRLAELGVERLTALAVTHPELDHDGGVAEVLERIATGRLVHARAGRPTLGTARAHGARPLRIAAGDRLRAGALRLEVLWPPAERLAQPGPVEDPNELSLVLLARWRGFALLLAGDAEAEAAPVEPGDVDVLKIAHHGSQDAGLGALLERADPELALISAGAGNPFGHPAAETLAALADAGIPVARTDEAGELVLEVDRAGWRLAD